MVNFFLVENCWSITVLNGNQPPWNPFFQSKKKSTPYEDSWMPHFHAAIVIGKSVWFGLRRVLHATVKRLSNQATPAFL